MNTISNSSLGMMAEMGEACGLREKKAFNLLRDSASAETFCTPGRCLAVTFRSKTADRKAKERNRCIRDGSRAEPLLTAATTDTLSHMQYTCFPAQCMPQSATAITMGTSSLGAMDVSAQSLGYCVWNHRFLWMAPQPHEPDASDTT